MKKKRTAAVLRQKQYVIAGALVVIAAVGMTWFYTSQQAKSRQEKEQQLAREAAQAKEEQLADAAEEPTETGEEASAAASVTVLPQEDAAVEAESVEENVEEEKEETSAASVTQDTLHFSEEEGLMWPMQGDVILGFSMDKTVYFATLEQYKYNPAMLIAGEVNNKVCAASQGKITDISQSEVTGCTVTMDLGDGYTAIYGQLKDLNFAVGDLVEEGQVLGYVSEPTKYFSVEGSSLYFEVQKDGVPQDPVSLIHS